MVSYWGSPDTSDTSELLLLLLPSLVLGRSIVRDIKPDVCANWATVAGATAVLLLGAWALGREDGDFDLGTFNFITIDGAFGVAVLGGEGSCCSCCCCFPLGLGVALGLGLAAFVV